MKKALAVGFRYLLIFLIPTFLAWAVSNIWALFYKHLPNFSANDDFALFGCAGLLGVIYSIFAAQVMGSVWDRFEEIRILCKSAQERDREIFIMKKDIHINPLIHSVLGCLAIVILIILGLVSYDSKFTGQIVVGSWTLVVTLLLVIANELDKPLSGIWYITPPKEWRKDNVKELYPEKIKNDSAG